LCSKPFFRESHLVTEFGALAAEAFPVAGAVLAAR
jgi:hypothetical protein